MKWRPQYRLRTLLAVVTACAVLSWGYLYVWPWWRLYREQMLFEQAVKQLKAGNHQFIETVLPKSQTPYATNTIFADTSVSTGEPVVFSAYAWENACYCICWILPPQAGGTLKISQAARIEVYRLPPVPRNFQPARVAGADPAADANLLADYVSDWARRTAINPQQPGTDCRLIYSDPPAK